MLCALPWALIAPNWFVLFKYDLIKLENAIVTLCFVSDLIPFSQNKDVFWGSRTGIISVVKRSSSLSSRSFSYDCLYMMNHNIKLSSSQVSEVFKAREHKQSWNYPRTNPVVKSPYAPSRYVKIQVPYNLFWQLLPFCSIVRLPPYII